MLKEILLVLGVIGIAFLGTLAYLGRTDVLTQIGVIISEKMQAIQTTFQPITQNPLLTPILAIAVPLVTWKVTSWLKNREIETQLKLQANNFQNQASNQIYRVQQEAQNQIKKMQEKLDAQPNITTLQSNLSEAETLVSQQAKQIQNITTNFNNLQKMCDPDRVRALEQALTNHNIPIPTLQIASDGVKVITETVVR